MTFSQESEFYGVKKLGQSLHEKPSLLMMEALICIGILPLLSSTDMEFFQNYLSFNNQLKICVYFYIPLC